MAYSYRAYGLTCLSDSEIRGFHPELITSPSPDIFISLYGQPPPWVVAARTLPARKLFSKPALPDDGDSAYTITVFGAERYFELAYSDGSSFLIDEHRRRLWGCCPASLPSDYLETYLRGPVMGFLLRRRNVTALHASAIRLCDRAIVLCGESQSGKSTTAAAFALNETPVICDDIAPLARVGDQLLVHPGYPQIGLWPDAVRALLGASDALPRWTQTWPKCFLSLDEGSRRTFETRPLPLGAVYLLAPRTHDADSPRIEELSLATALIQLVQNTYMNCALSREQRVIEFDSLSSLVMSVPVRKIVPHSDPAQLGLLCGLIAKDVERLTRQSAVIALRSA